MRTDVAESLEVSIDEGVLLSTELGECTERSRWGREGVGVNNQASREKFPFL